MSLLAAKAWLKFVDVRFGALAALMLLLTPLDTSAVAESVAISKEYQLKAAFLFNFAQFVEWPPTAFAEARSPIRICVLGENPFGDLLQHIIEGETIQKRTLVLIAPTTIGDAAGCHLLFIPHSEAPRLQEILPVIGTGYALTVSDIDEFARKGGNVNFYLDHDRIRFEVNPTSALRQGLHLSAQLLKLGRVVSD